MGILTLIYKLQHSSQMHLNNPETHLSFFISTANLICFSFSFSNQHFIRCPHDIRAMFVTSTTEVINTYDIFRLSRNKFHCTHRIHRDSWRLGLHIDLSGNSAGWGELNRLHAHATHHAETCLEKDQQRNNITARITSWKKHICLHTKHMLQKIDYFITKLSLD